MDLLTISPVEISSKTGVPTHEVQYFVDVLKSEVEEPHGVESIDCFTTGDDQLDSLLNGGIHLGLITEIFGESATGKSQLCMQLTRTCSLSTSQGGLGSKSVYISTEGNLETKRLVEINPTLDSVFCINCMDLEAQEHILEVQLPVLIQKEGVKLVVIDSISHHLRVELEHNGFKSYLKNKNKMTEICKKLLDLCADYGVAIVVTNQISDVPEKEILQSDYKKISMDYQLGWLSGWDHDMMTRDEIKGGVPTLGISWSNNVLVRILLKKYYQRGDEEFWRVQRQLKLVFSPFAEQDKEISFEINKSGIRSA
jgi:DNA repair protein RAD57